MQSSLERCRLQPGGSRVRVSDMAAAVEQDSRLTFGNLASFVAHVTPRAKLRYITKDEALGGPFREGESRVPFFSLRELWDSFEEPSCFGVGVPISTGGANHVTQFYVPYLSGIQLFTREDDSSPCESRSESDFGGSDLLDSSSDSSDTSDRQQGSCPDWSSVELEDWQVPELEDDQVDVLRCSHLQDCEPAQTAEWPLYSQDNLRNSCPDCGGGQLCFQFFEKERPHLRPPLFDKVSELMTEHSVLATSRSLDLHPSSWFSIAWYPSCSLPTSLSRAELGASFLTFHSLSTPLPHPSETCQLCREEYWIAPSNLLQHPAFQERGGTDSEYYEGPMALFPFGFCAYRAWGSLWTDGWQATSLAHAASDWVKQMRVNHPDHTFFAGRRPF